jgi:glutathione S-transferase
MNEITVTAFRWVPPFARGLVKDLRVRWALEEAGLDYQTRLISQEEKLGAAHLRRQPFGQVPVFEQGDLQLFESGAIVLHIARQSEVLLPADANASARATTWAFAALNSIEPVVQRLAEIDLFHADETWAELRRPAAIEAAASRLRQLSHWLDGREYLEGSFTVGDLLMTTVLRDLRQTDLLARFPVLDAYRARCERRPAFQQALADQLADFVEDDEAASATASSGGDAARA